MNLPKTYEPNQYQTAIYALWESSGAFSPQGNGDPYCIVMPPPNANGNLHVGHGYMIPIEDILVRYYRMQGRRTIWIPGADHAGFETWVVFERSLNQEGKSRFDYSREELYRLTWDFVQRNRGNMELQIRALGASCDWNNKVFTLDKKVVDTVYHTFKQLWDDGLVYRGNRIVNFCPKHQTAFADIEVDFKPVKSHLWHIVYRTPDGSRSIEVATTRPETMLGDTAIAVHPEDERYTDLVGKTVVVPLIDREIPVVADEGVERDFGTGAVKITPAHDPLDFEIGQRHHLPQLTVIATDGTMINVPDKYQGMTVEQARAAVVDDLTASGALVKTEDFTHDEPHCYKCGSTIQPLMMKQWFINVKPLAQRAREAVARGEVRFVPEHKGQELIHYYDELRDWNISRQIPWGIPIPAFHAADNPDEWIFDPRVDQTEIEINGRSYVRDEDTFDTWFSSGQWPFVTTDVITDGKLKEFYPNAVMETGVDILRAWVARMIMLGLYTTGKVPFHDVFLHGLILDKHGQKMSKSKGNVLNPMDIVERYGSDALRIGIVMNRSAGQPQAFSEDSVIAGRNFCNKLWNIARYIDYATEQSNIGLDDIKSAKPTSIAEHWISRQFNQAKHTVDSLIAQYRFAEAVETIYHFVWDELADWYIEASKNSDNAAFMRQLLENTLKLVHPFAPFVTETIWTTIHDDTALLISQPWPRDLTYSKRAANQFDQVKSLVVTLRNITQTLPNGKYTLVHDSDPLLVEQGNLVASLAKLRQVKVDHTPHGLHVVSNWATSWLELSREQIDAYKKHLVERLTDAKEQIGRLEQRLANRGYVDHAPAELVAESKRQLNDLKHLATKLSDSINDIS